jgi:hypothetical protein
MPVYLETLKKTFIHPDKISEEIFLNSWTICFEFYPRVPWIPKPSTVNNKLKRPEGSGSTGRFFD